jgi:ABC-2 type transport system ATP-binding protein
MAAILVDDLRKKFATRVPGQGWSRYLFRPEFRETEALGGVTFTIEPGERVAFVGPNGAGKSTTIKILSGILFPTSGRVEVAGLVPWKDRRRLGYRIGTVFGQRSQLWYHLPAGDTFDLLAQIYDLSPADYRSRRAELTRAFEVERLLERPVRALSLGERMRCEIVASLLHRPEILFLDEPTIGLDVTAKAVIRDLVTERSRRDGTTILLTSHDTGDMEQVCDRVLVINTGRLLLDKPVQSLRMEFIRRKLITLITAEPSVSIQIPGVRTVESKPHRLVLEIDTTMVPVEKVVDAAMKASPLRDLTVEDPPMEEIVKEIYRGG